MSKRKFTSRSVARLNAVQALYQLDKGDDNASSVIKDFLENRMGSDVEGDLYKQPDTTLFVSLVRGTEAQLDTLDEMVTAHLGEGWTLHRMDGVLKAILRVGAYELAFASDTPTPVILNEYLDITRAFFDTKEVAFINSVLDKIAKIVRSQE